MVHIGIPVEINYRLVKSRSPLILELVYKVSNTTKLTKWTGVCVCMCLCELDVGGIAVYEEILTIYSRQLHRWQAIISGVIPQVVSFPGGQDKLHKILIAGMNKSSFSKGWYHYKCSIKDY